MRALLLAVGLAVGAIVLASSSVDEGEVVTLISTDSAGAAFETQLWIVDVDGSLYLRAGSPHSRWLARLRAQPHVTLVRGGVRVEASALPQTDPKILSLVNERMAEKYGYADRLWAHLVDRDHSVPILLEPRSGP